MSKIKLDPSVLLAQATEMENLGNEYASLFSSVTSVLNQTNENWSANLAHNFSGKITTAQKGFSGVVDMLDFGASAAKTSAETFSSIDSQLAKAMSGSANSSKQSSLIQFASNSMSDLEARRKLPGEDLPEVDEEEIDKIKAQRQAEKEADEKFVKSVCSKIPKEIRAALKVAGFDLEELLLKFINSELTLEDVEGIKVLKKAVGKVPFAGPIANYLADVIDNILTCGSNTELSTNREMKEYYEHLAAKALSEGDWGAVIGYLVKCVGYEIDKAKYIITDPIMDARSDYQEKVKEYNKLVDEYGEDESSDS